MANDRDELMRLAERLRLAASAPDSPRRIEGIAADLRALAQRAPQNGAVPLQFLKDFRADVLTIKDNPHKGDMVFRCGINGAVDVVVSRIDALIAASPAHEATNCGPACARRGAPTGSAYDERGCGYLDSGNGAPEAERAKGEAVAWAQDTPYGRAYSFADELGKAFPGLLSAPPTAGQPEGVDDYERIYAEVIKVCADQPMAHEIASRLASAQRAGKDGA